MSGKRKSPKLVSLCSQRGFILPFFFRPRVAWRFVRAAGNAPPMPIKHAARGATTVRRIDAILEGTTERNRKDRRRRHKRRILTRTRIDSSYKMRPCTCRFFSTSRVSLYQFLCFVFFGANAVIREIRQAHSREHPTLLS